MTLLTGEDWNVYLRALQVRWFGNVEVTGGAFTQVVTLIAALVMVELDRNALLRPVSDFVRICQLVAALTLSVCRLLTSPMTTETVSMTVGQAFEC